jgi:CheY-like chemotaxis protein
VVSSLDCREIPVMVDNSQLQMLFDAIIINAIEAVADQCIIEISCSEQELAEEFIRSHPGSEYGSYVCFSVKDNGCGMNEETLKRIFEPFYSTKFAGRGLGMAAVYGIVKNHGGYISVDSKLDKGTLVEVYLPLLSLQESTVIAKTAEPAAKLTVLLIEDEEMLHTVEKRLLETLGYNVLIAKNGREALQLAKDYQKSVDLVLMDIHLPDITADILYLKLMEACPTMKIILCSGSAMEWTAQKALNAGAEGFFEKPFSLQKLNDALSKVINMC